MGNLEIFTQANSIVMRSDPSKTLEPALKSKANQDGSVRDHKDDNTKDHINDSDINYAIDVGQDLGTYLTRENQRTLALFSTTSSVDPLLVPAPAEGSHIISKYPHGGTPNGDGLWHDSFDFDLDDSANILESTRSWNWLSPRMNPTPKPTLDPSPIKYKCTWKRSNVIYGKLFSINSTGGLTARESRVNILFKAVRKGWESVSAQERSDPVLEILKEVDEEIFEFLDPVTRIAALQKSHMLLTVRYNLFLSECALSNKETVFS